MPDVDRTNSCRFQDPEFIEETRTFMLLARMAVEHLRWQAGHSCGVLRLIQRSCRVLEVRSTACTAQQSSSTTTPHIVVPPRSEQVC